jgi:hypothetical protein
MQIVAPGSPNSGRTRTDFPKRLLKPFARLLQTGNPAATVDRLFCSQHVTDLRLIIAFALIAVLLVLGIGLPLSFESSIVSQWPTIVTRKTDWTLIRIGFTALNNFLTFFTPVLAVFGAILAWAYQVGSARLGVVDLFACEISTLCRVATVVDTVRRCIDVFEQGPPAEPAGTHLPRVQSYQFTSQENYFPVFESNARDLQTLEARVVINITAFYTYMKAVRDSLRSLAEIRARPAELESPTNKGPVIGPWHEAARNVVYMLFLGLESARHAVTDLVEFEPDEAEKTVVILLSELEAYRFLCSQFTDEQDMRHQRIVLRDSDYRRLVPKLYCAVEAGKALEEAKEVGTKSDEPRETSQWELAWRLLPELRRRYEAATNRSIPDWSTVQA